MNCVLRLVIILSVVVGTLQTATSAVQIHIPIQSGLVLRVEATTGVTVQNGTVSEWVDQSVSGNNLNSVTGNPVLVAGATPTGQPAIVLDGGADGSDDGLSRFSDINNLPAGAEDRTVFVVARYDSINTASGFAYGWDRPNRAFGLGASDNGNLEVQGWGRENDFISDVQAVAAGWIVHSVVLRNNQILVYRNGQAIDSADHVYDTDVRSIAVGLNLRENGSNAMSVAAVFVYDNALEVLDRLETEAYLQDTYIGLDSVDDAPIAASDLFQVPADQPSSLNILDNDYDDEAALDFSSIVATSPGAGTISSVNSSTGEVVYQADPNTTSDTFDYQVSDAAGNVSNIASVTIGVGDAGAFDLSNFSDTIIASAADGLQQPISMEFLEDNRILLAEKNGVIRILDPLTGNSQVYLELNNINSGNERGLLDLTLDPDFEQNGYVYLFYTPGSPQSARISRFTHAENSGGLTSTAIASSEFIVFEESDDDYDSCCHYGGGLDFGPDGKLWLTISDKFHSSAPGEGTFDDDVSVDLSSTSGKIVRVNPDGTFPDGSDGWPANPFIGAGDNANDAIWAYGLRNPFRAEFDEVTGLFYIGEVGGNQNGLSSEDLHIASLDQPGVFYGWPFYEGQSDVLVNTSEEATRLSLPLADGDIGDPANGDLYSSSIWSYQRNDKASIIGGFVYRGDQFPDEWNGVYFYGDYSRDIIRYLRLGLSGRVVLGSFDFLPSDNLPAGVPNIVSLNQGKDGALYYLNFSNNGAELHRVAFNDGNEVPAIVSVDAAPVTGATIFDYEFTATVSDTDGLTYTWFFGDGSQVSGVPGPDGTISVTHSYSTEGFYDVSLQVSDGVNTVFSLPINITVGDPNDAPVITDFSASDTQLQPGETVTFTALASDPDADALSYTLEFGDGSVDIGTVPGNGIVNVTYTYGTEGVYNALLTVSDITSQTTSLITLTIGETTGVPETNGLVLALESTIKIGLTGNVVNAWLDGSGLGNNLTAAGDPTLVDASTPSGLPAIVFDGVDDSLFREESQSTPITGFPEGSGARTFFLVGKYELANGVFAGFAYGDDRRDNAFGLITNGNSNQLTVQAWGSGDNPSGVDAPSQGWMSQSVVLNADGSYTHYLNGLPIDTGTNNFDTVIERIAIAENLGGGGQLNVSVAAIFGYDRALSESERLNVEQYLQDTYLSGAANIGPVANDDSTSVEEEGTISIDVLANDTDPEGNPLLVTALNGEALASGDVITLDGGTSITFVAPGSLTLVAQGTTTDIMFTYTVSDGSLTDTAVVDVTVTPPVVNTAPMATNDNITAFEGETVVSNVVSNDVDAENDPLFVSAINATPVVIGDTVTLSDGAVVTLGADSELSITPVSDSTADVTFNYTVSDGSLTDTGNLTVSFIPITNTGSAPVTDGLIVEFQSDNNVALLSDGSTVDGWLDGSGFGTDLVAGGNPVLLANATPTGQPAISFDGVDDFLSREGGANLSGLPAGNQDRSVFFVVDYQSASSRLGVAFGRGRSNRAFGITVDGRTNVLAVQGWGSNHDFLSSTSAGDNDGVDEWLVQSAVLSNDTLTHYLNGSLIDSTDHVYNTDVSGAASRFVIGEEISSGDFGQLEVAAVLIFDRALNLSEHSVVTQYLFDKYISDDPGSNNNTGPLGVDDVGSVSAGEAVIVDVLLNDTDADGDSLSVVEIDGVSVVVGDVVTLADNSSITLMPQGELSVASVAGSASNIVFSYTITDGMLTDTAQVTVTVTAAANTAPAAMDDTFSVNEGSTVDLNVLANDTDVDGDSLSITEINGTPVDADDVVTLSDGSSITLTPQDELSVASVTGSASVIDFSYTVTDGLLTDTAQVTVNVTPTGGNLSNDVTLPLDEGSGIIANDTTDGDGNGTLLGGASFAPFTGDGSSHSVLFDGNNDIIDLGPLDVEGNELSLTAWFNANQFPGNSRDPRIISKANGVSSNSHVFMLSTIRSSSNTRLRGRVRIGGVTTTVIASSGNLNTGSWHHAALTYDGSNVRLYLDGVQVGSRSLSGIIDTAPSINVAVGGQPDQSTRLWDGYIDDVRILNRALTSAEVAGIAAGGGSAPVATDDSYSTDNTSTLSVPAAGVLTNDSGTSLSAVTLTTTTNGTLVLNTDGSFDYTPNAGFTGTDSFTYQAIDGQSLSSTAQVTVTVTAAANTAPAAMDDTFSVNEGSTVDLNVLANDTDVDGDSLSITEINGTPVDADDVVTLSDGSSITLTPQDELSVASVTGSASVIDFSYTVTDGLLTDTAQVTVNVTPTGGNLSNDVTLPLDEGSGIIANDTTDGDGNGTLLGGASFAPFTGDGSSHSVLFDGNNDIIDLGPLDVEGNELSLTAWFNANQFPGNSRDPRIISKANGVSSNSHVFMLSTIRSSSNTRLRGRVRIGGVTTTVIASSGNLNTGSWHHAALTYDGSNVRLYLDGVQVGSRSLSGIIDTAPSINVAVGGQPDQSTRLWDGYIDDVRILNRALTSAEVSGIAAGQ